MKKNYSREFKIVRQYLLVILFFTTANIYGQLSIRYQNEIQGGATMIGNSFQSPAAVYVDADSDASTTRSTYSDLILPAGSTIVKAFLYMEKSTNVFYRDFKFQAPGNAYVTIPISEALSNRDLSGYNQLAFDVTKYITSPTTMYSSSSGGGASGRYFVADYKSAADGTFSQNNGGGWSMIVVYKNPVSKNRFVSVQDTWFQYYRSTSSAVIPGVKVPATGPVKAVVGATAVWGDPLSSCPGCTDEVRFGQTGTTLTRLTDPVTNTSNDFENSTIGITANNNVSLDGGPAMSGNVLTRNDNGATTRLYDSDIADASGILPASTTPISVTVQYIAPAGSTDIIYAGATFISVDLEGAVLHKSLSTGTIIDGGTASYTFTITNPSSTTKSGLAFTDTLPSGIRIATPPNIIVSGVAPTTVSATGGGTTFAMSGLTLAPGQSTSIKVDITNVPGMLNANCSTYNEAFSNGYDNINTSASSSNLIVDINPQVCLQVICKPNSTLPGCDFDGDGISNQDDIDDDNDGILDAVESPSCYYTKAEAEVFVGYSSDFTVGGTATYTILNDGNTTATTYVGWTANQDWVGTDFTGRALLRMDYTAPVYVTGFQYYAIQNIQQSVDNGSYVLQGSNDGGVTWTNLSPVQTSTVLNTLTTITNSLHPNTAYSSYRIAGYTGTNYLARFREAKMLINNAITYIPSLFPKATCTNDTDGDGINNQFDLDSDGDGCPDAKESGVTGTLLSGNVVNGTPNTTTSTVNAVAQGPYGTNGYADSLETTVDNGIPNFTSTYDLYATSATLNFCKDTDGDGISDLFDLDDDNDGVLDTDEGLQCNVTTSDIKFNTAANVLQIPYSPLVNGTKTGSFSVGGTTYNYTAVVSGADIGVFGTCLSGNGSRLNAVGSYVELTFTPPINSVIFDIADLGPQNENEQGQLTINGSTNLTGFNVNVSKPSEYCQGNDLVINSSTGLVTQTGSEVDTFTVIEGKISKIRYTKTFETATAAAHQVVFSVINSAACTTTDRDIDTDGDGIPNRLDLDSDGDGCPDAKGTGVSGTLLSGNVVNGTPNTTVTLSNAIAQGAYGNNGLANGVETNDSQTAAVTYKNTYNPLALSKVLNACSDSDGDGLSDLVDIDDDNDGILDAIESPSCFYTVSEITAQSALTAWSDFAFNSILPITNAIDNNTTTFTQLEASNMSTSLVNKTIIEYDMKDAIKISNLTISASYMSSDANSTFVLQGWDGLQWLDLSAPLADATLTQHNIVLNNTLQANAKFSKIREFHGVGTAGVGTIWYCRIYDTQINALNFNPSEHPKATCSSDFDNDGINNYLDLDSDNDGCLDAIEGDENVAISQLVSASTSLSVGIGSSAPRKNLCSSTSCVDITGVPTIVNTGGSADIGSDQGQDIGSSQNKSVVSVECSDPCYSGSAYFFDYDGDTVGNVCDLDDDNDGILDADECAVIDVTIPSSNNTNGQVEANGNIINAVFSTSGGIINTNSTPNFTFAESTNATLGATYTFTFDRALYDASFYFSNINYASDTQKTVIGNFSVTMWDNTTYNNVDFAIREPINSPLKISYSTNNYHAIQGTILGGANQAGGFIDFVGIPNSTTNGIKSISFRLLLNNTGSALNAYVYPKITSVCDTDGDTIPNYLDLDSDNDGCPDAIEGASTTITSTDLVSSTLPGGNSGATSGTYNQPVVLNLGNSIDANGIPTIASGGKGAGNAYNSSVSDGCAPVVCYNPVTNFGTADPTNHGITLLKRAGADNGNWPMIRNSGFTALESNTKGFVITRVHTADIPLIAEPVEGMMIYDIDVKCLKINTNGTTSGWSCFDKPACP